jgi:penicillin-binding protein 1B
MTGGAAYIIDWVQQLLAERAAQAGELVAVAPGQPVITTIDPALQRAAESAVREGLARAEQGSARRADSEPLQAALVAIDPRTGAIKALVGGRNYQQSQFNRVVQARRQPGSLFKPVVYLAALERSGTGPPPFTLASIVDDEPITLEAGGMSWTPQNVDLVYRGPVTFRQVAESSLNAATVRIAATVGFDQVVRMARRTGASDHELPALPSVALGALETTPLEMARFYAMLAGGGRRVEPRMIDLMFRPGDGADAPRLGPEAAVAASPEAAYLVTSLLGGVIDRGTGRLVRAMGFDRPAAGKTGTSSDLHDAWFAGYTPELVALVWVGYDRPKSIGLTGAQAALPIWTRFMQQALSDVPVSDFEPPEGVVSRRIDPASGALATWRCPESVPEWFIAGTEPTTVCQGEGPAGVVRGWLARAWDWLRN